MLSLRMVTGGDPGHPTRRERTFLINTRIDEPCLVSGRFRACRPLGRPWGTKRTLRTCGAAEGVVWYECFYLRTVHAVPEPKEGGQWPCVSIPLSL